MSAVIFNALIIPALIPLAVRGVKWKPVNASAILLRNIAVYGVGGLIVPFIGIKVIDLVVSAFTSPTAAEEAKRMSELAHHTKKSRTEQALDCVTVPRAFKE